MSSHAPGGSIPASAFPPPPDEPATGWPDPPGCRLVAPLGEGGMGAVFRADQPALGRAVAVKFLRGPAADPALVGRFRTEAAALARAAHPNVVQVFEVGETAGHPYLLLELLPGGTLAQKLTAGPLAPRDAAGLVRTLADAVQAAHAAGVVHRDLKPANVLFAADGRPKVADFGLAKWTAADTPRPDVTATGAVLGTPAYMAPEQARGDSKAVGPAADVYALGAVLYECLTGRPPCRAAATLDTLNLVCTADPPPPRQLQPGVPRDLETVCLTCLRKNPARRYPSARALADDLDRFLAGRPVTARPVGRAERLVRWGRRNPGAATAVGLVVATAVVGAAGLTVHNRRLTAALDEQTRLRQRADDQYAAAVSTIRGMLARTAAGRTPVPAVYALEKQQAEDALAFFRAVATPDAGPAVRAELGEACLTVARRANEVGDRATAGPLYREGIAVLDPLAAAAPADRLLQRRAALAHGQYGFYLLGADPAAAEAELTEAVGRYGRLTAADPTEAESHHRLGQFLYNLGVLRRRADKLDEAADFYRRSDAAHAAGAAAEPPTPQRRVMRADSLLGLGLVAWGRKQYAEADGWYARADAELQTAVAAEPASLDAALTRGSLFINWGLVAQDAGDKPRAVERFGRAVDLLEGVVGREPQSARVRQPLFNAHGARGELLHALGRSAEAAADLERAADFAANPGKVADTCWKAAGMWAAAGKPDKGLAALARSRTADAAGWPARRKLCDTDESLAALRGHPGWAAARGP